MQVARYDRGTVKGDAVVSADGYIKANAVVTRSGIFEYQNQDGTIRKELRHPDHVWNADSIQSMKMIPVTNGHPRERMVTPENFKRLAIGYTGENIVRDENHVLANFVITDQEGVDAVIKSGRKELSLGYLVDLDETPGEFEGEKYDAIQTNIRYNHLAIVDKARAGAEARIALDRCDAVEFINEGKLMSKRKIKLDDNEEALVEGSVADYVGRLEIDLKNLSDERDRVEMEIKEIRARLEKALVERDSLQDNVAEMKTAAANNMDDAKFKSAVKERVQLFSHAYNILGQEASSKLDSMSDMEIKKEIIRKAKKSINLDGKNQSYLDAMFDIVISEKIVQKVNVDNVTYKENSDSNSANPLVNSQQKMMSYQKSLFNAKTDGVE